MSTPSAEGLALAAKTVRVLTVDAVRQAGIGHVGLPTGCAELGATLFADLIRHDPEDPSWPDRDRFVLSAGHGSMLLYSLLHLSGYDLPMEQIRNFRQLGSITPGHPEHGMTPGVEVTTGPLGQGLANAVGMALAERILAARFGSELVDHRTWVLASDGDMMEGVASEAASLAGHLGLGRLIVFYDDNGITIDGPTGLAFSEDVGRRFEAYGWDVQRVDGHDPEAIRNAAAAARDSEARPHLIVTRTHIGQGTPNVDTSAAHGGINDEKTAQTREQLGWTLPPFELPDEARAVFRPNAERGARERKEWLERKQRILADESLAKLWRAMIERELPDDPARLVPDLRDAGTVATRQASGQVINAVAPRVPSLIGGSADLAGSNNTTQKEEASIERGKFDGRNLHFGVREHAMGAIANGLSLHGGVRPYVATFLVFSDYMRPAVRLAALMKQPVTFVYTHDSIFVGEDGPTHQPVEQVAALRAIPGLHVWRPADARETAVAWAAALRRDDGPVALILTRQGVDTLDVDGVEEGAARGGYVVERESGGEPELVLIATGSEVGTVRGAAALLRADGRRVRVVSLPCLDVFASQSEDHVADVLGDAPRLVVEAGVELGLSPLLRPGDLFHGQPGFGESAPWKDLAKHFGFTPERVAEVAREMLG